ncbi:MAG: replicative DNA helicase [Myxococcota bacterium]|nr:replicative DNA helicase [Myxococcota bacterium]
MKDYPPRRSEERKDPVATEGRTPPYNQEAEAAVLGGILLNNEALHLVQPLLGPDDFYIEAHRRIYESMAALARLGLPIDHVTLGNELKKRGDLDKIGGAMALASLTDHVLNDAEAAIFKASQQNASDQYTHVSRIVEKTFRDLEEASGRTGEVTGIPTGFTRLDKMTAGLQRSDLIIIAGRPAMGKTSFALSIALNAAKLTRQPVVIFSLEMSKDQLVRRLLTSEGRVNASKMRANSLDRSDWPRLVQAANDLSGYPIYLDDSTPMTPVEIRAKSRRLLAEKGLCLVIVDYLQLMHAGGRRKDNREQEISEISRSLKAMAKELNVPVIALSQLNRSVESRPDKRPMMSDLRESGAIEQDADIIMFVYRDEVYTKDACEKPGVAEIIIGKQRSGPTGIIETRFFSDYTRFDNLSGDEPPDGVEPPPGFGGGHAHGGDDDY